MAHGITRLLGAIALSLVLGCSAANPSATGEQTTDTGPDGPGLTTHILSDTIVLYAVPPSTDAKVVDYLIVADKTDEIVYHVESASNMNHFRLELEVWSATIADTSALDEGWWADSRTLGKEALPTVFVKALAAAGLA